jgi:glutamate 2,3-aminomutase
VVKGQGLERERASERASSLVGQIAGYLERRHEIKTGFDAAERIAAVRRLRLDRLGATDDNWNDWKWQMKQRHVAPRLLGEILRLTAEDQRAIDRAHEDSVVSISPYYMSLMDLDDPACPIRRQAVPDAAEYDGAPGSLDPSGEVQSSPVRGWVQRYPNRGILLVNDIGACAVACRFCQRRHNLSPAEPEHSNDVDIAGAIDYIRRTPTISDVLLTGGDALVLSDGKLESILQRLRSIPHVEIIRLGTRLPVTLPQRVTPELCALVARYGLMGGHGAIWVVTHFNHPMEITPEAAQACRMLLCHGMPVVNQSVLMAGINDDPMVMARLNQELVRIGVKPYYLFDCKSVDGATHFRTGLDRGLEVMEYLNGRISGLAVPSYVVSLPDGRGKVRLGLSPRPERSAADGWRVVSWEGDEVLYEDS